MFYDSVLFVGANATYIQLCKKPELCATTYDYFYSSYYLLKRVKVGIYSYSLSHMFNLSAVPEIGLGTCPFLSSH